MKGRTTFVTSHRLSLVRNADTILVFEAGRLTERGTHAKLLAQSGLYAGMYEMQMGQTPPTLEENLSNPLASHITDSGCA
jgi:ABC-type multidrug transport system fused ATPase/permease subunit